MSTPLVDIDANPRQPGFRSTKEGSKIPSPSKFQQSGSTGHRSPFSVSTTGSPCYVAMPTTSKAVVSPTPASKLPRKSTSTQSTFSKSYTYGTRPATPRPSLPRSRGGTKQSAITVAPLPNPVRMTPPLSCNKPLPSPPIAYVVNPESPPKAQRTLVDAEAGTPTEEQWPIIQPENVSISGTLRLLPNDGLPQRSVSEGSALRRNGIPVLKSRVNTSTPHSVNNHTPSQKSPPSIADDELSHKKFRQMTEPRTFSSMNPYAKSFHAISTNTDVAIESPLAHKGRTPPAVSVPPRISSKRSSLPLPDKSQDGTSTQPPTDPARSVKPGSTKWPVLETIADPVLVEKPITAEHCGHEQGPAADPVQNHLVFSGCTPATQSHHGSIGSASTWSMAAGSSLNDEAEVDYEGIVRVKRLSWHSSNPDSGPTLRISADADTVLLGQDDSIPAVPTLPEFVPTKMSQERSLSTLAGRVSKQVLVKMIPSTGSRSSTPSSVGAYSAESRPIRITPIRSMQPPRKPSTGDLSKKSTSPVESALEEVGQDKQVPNLSRDDFCSSFETAQGTPLSQTKSESEHAASNETQGHSYETGNYSTTLQSTIPQKAMQVLGTDGDTPTSAIRRRLPITWMTPKSATLSAKKTDEKRSKTSQLLLSAERLNHRATTSSTRSPSSASSNLARSTPSPPGARRPDPSILGAILNAPQASSDARHIEYNAADVALKIKAKRSFRNIFHRRDPNSTPQPAKKHDSKRPSVAGSALAQRIRNSTNFSKVSLARPTHTKPEIQQRPAISSLNSGTLDKETDRKAALSALEAGAIETSPQPAPVAHYETATVIHNILNRVTSMGAGSPDRLRGLEIVEAVLHAAECSKQAKISVELARKHARDADLNAQRAGVELKRLEKLCEPGFDDETLQALKQLVTAAGAVELSETVEQ